MRYVAVIAAAMVAVAVGVGGCAGTDTVPVDYSPSSTLTATGAVQIATFNYLPSINGKMKPNQLRNTAMGDILLNKTISAYFHDALFTELRFVGVKVGSGNVQLSGDIKEFLVDDLGYSIDWTVDVHYVVKDSGGKVIYDSEKVTKNRTAKFANAFVALNQQVKQNIESLITDADFIKAIN
jgi:uncharacterized lipoprotein